ncbi:hypothetical protein KKB69_01495 [Patescibacteria group bacterium]|nr:hypothetical protein [Patescibacteria group bacterium]
MEKIENETQKLSPEKQIALGLAAETIKSSDRAQKLLIFATQEYLPTTEQLEKCVNTEYLYKIIKTLWEKYPTLKELENGLNQLVEERIDIQKEENMTSRQYHKKVEKKQQQYKEEGVQKIVEAMTELYK